MGISEQLAIVRRRIAAAAERAGRKADDITLVAVTKTRPAAMIREALDAGVTDVGENRVQEALAKKAELDSAGLKPRWHLIGHLQGNKAKQAVQHFELIHSVDSFGLAREIDKHALKAGKVQRILLQFNISGEQSKFGGAPEEARELVRQVAGSCPNVRVEGLMTMAPFSDNAEDARPWFRGLRKLTEHLRSEFSIGRELSMGMTGDFEVAIEEGATLLRIGSAVFGTTE